MGKASSAKKIKRVQQAGVSRAPGQRRQYGYPALIAGIVIVGSVLVFFARDQQSASAGEAPVANKDHWHAAYALNICGENQPNPSDDGPDTKGIHTHGDGLVHIHPFVGAASGESATFQVYADQLGIELTDDSMTLPDGTKYTNGEDCKIDGKKKPGQVTLYVWPPQATDATDPEVITEDIGATRFTDDGQVFVLAFVPKGYEMALPPSMEALANPIDEEPEPQPSDETPSTESVPAADPGSAEPEGQAPASTDTTAPTTSAGG